MYLRLGCGVSAQGGVQQYSSVRGCCVRRWAPGAWGGYILGGAVFCRLQAGMQRQHGLLCAQTGPRCMRCILGGAGVMKQGAFCLWVHAWAHHAARC